MGVWIIINTSHRNRGLLDARLQPPWCHGVQGFVSSGHVELRCTRCLGGSLFRLNTLNILKLSDLTATPLGRPGGAAYILGTRVIYKRIDRNHPLEHSKTYQCQDQDSFSSAFYEYQNPLPWETDLQIAKSNTSLDHMQPSTWKKWGHSWKKVRWPTLILCATHWSRVFWFELAGQPGWVTCSAELWRHSLSSSNWGKTSWLANENITHPLRTHWWVHSSRNKAGWVTGIEWEWLLTHCLVAQTGIMLRLNIKIRLILDLDKVTLFAFYVLTHVDGSPFIRVTVGKE